MFLSRLRTFTIFVFILIPLSAQSSSYQYSIGGGISSWQLSGSDFFDYNKDQRFSLLLGHRVSDRWLIHLAYSSFDLNNDTNISFSNSISVLANNSPLQFEADRFAMTINRLLFDTSNPLNLYLGGGGGLLVWRGVQPDSNKTFLVQSDKLEPTDYAATELFLSLNAGVILKMTSRWALTVNSHFDYLTSAGAEFETQLADARDKSIFGFGAMLSLTLGKSGQNEHVSLPSSWNNQPDVQKVTRKSKGRDGDRDGVSDDIDRCVDTPRGVVVNRNGCAVDSDKDGVPDGLDDCPNSPLESINFVDIHGCPIDSDFDGIADYIDSCPDNQIGAFIDSLGCPIDSDNDGVPDGLDDCPHSLIDVAVDRHGCIDLGMFSKPMILNIDYVSGSFEIDPNNRERVKKLVGLLLFVSDIKLEINGYTDNIGTTVANRKLSEKRANRVRDYMVTLGIDNSRIKVFGRGESNFIASNRTSEGRAINRRIEIIFYK